VSFIKKKKVIMIVELETILPKFNYVIVEIKRS